MGAGIKRRAIATVATLFLAAGGSPGLLAAQQPATWLGGSGNWTDPTKWSGGVVPNNNGTDTYNVNIDNGNSAAGTVSLSASGASYSVDAVTIDAGERLFLDYASLNLNSLTVNGLLELFYTSSVKLPADTTIGGNGTIRYSLMPTQLSVSSGTMTINPALTVRGGSGDGSYYGGGIPYAARVGAAGTTLLNRGHILADYGVLTLAGNLDNQGTIEVGSLGILAFESDFSLNTIGNLVNNGSVVIAGTLQNAGQALTAARPREWVLRGTINGGTVNTTGNGYVYVSHVDTATLNNVTLNGTIVLDGNINVTGASGGNGTITINNPEPAEGKGNVFASTLPANITVRGGISTQFDGQYEGERATVHVNTNQGRIRAQMSIFNEAGRLRLLGDAGTITNAGALELSAGGTLTSLSNLTFASGGKLTIDGGGLLEVTGNLNLSTTFDSLDVKPRIDGQAYGGVIATYTGTLTGVFSSVTPGISVQYLTATKQIRISGTPVPEPGLLGLWVVTLGGLVCRRGGRRRLGAG